MPQAFAAVAGTVGKVAIAGAKAVAKPVIAGAKGEAAASTIPSTGILTGPSAASFAQLGVEGLGAGLSPGVASASQAGVLSGLGAGVTGQANPLNLSAKVGAGLGAGGTSLGKAGLTSSLLGGGGQASPVGSPNPNESPARPQSRQLFGLDEGGKMKMRTLEDFIEEEFNLG